MKMKQGGFNPLALAVFSLFLLMSVTPAKAQDMATATPAQSVGNTAPATTTGVSELPEVTVKAKGIDQAAAFDEMHDSLNKVNILSQDQIKQTPAKSVAQAARQFPGVGTQDDTSEARYIDIRGTDSNFNIVTFDHTILPSYDQANRSVDLDSIPAGLFGEMEIFKTIFPDMDSQGIGGQMNLVPKQAKDYPGGLFELKAEGEYFPERSQVGTNDYLTWADTFDLGGKSKLGILVTAGYQYSRFGIDDLENGYTDPSASPFVPNSVTDWNFRYYDYERDRAGIGANIDLSMDKDNKLDLSLLYSGYDEYRDPVWHSDITNMDAIAGQAATLADGSVSVNAAAAGIDDRKSFTSELTQFRNMAVGLGGVNNLGGFILDYKATFAYADQNVPYNYGYNFRTINPLTGWVTYKNNTNNGNMPSIDLSNLGGNLDPTNYYLYNGGGNSTSSYTVSSYGAKADGKFDTPLGGDDTGTVKFGAAARLEYSVANSESFSAVSIVGNTLNMSTVLGSTSTPYYPPNNIYNMGPLPGFTQTLNLLTNPNIYTGPFVQTDPVGDQGGDYNNWEDVYAGYAMYTAYIGKMTIMTGARLEVTHIQYNWNLVNQLDAIGDPTGPELAAPMAEIGTIDYANILPSLGFIYKFNPDLVTRINYSETIARPTQSQYIPAFGLGSALSAQNGNPVVNFTFGNPNLKPMISNNIDFSWELYPEKGAILAVDGFLKDVTNYVALNESRVDNSGGVTDSLNYFNIPSAQIYGVEFQVQQPFTFLPDPLDGFGFRGAISFIGSNGELVPGVYGELPSQSDLLWNAGLTYKKGGFTFDIAGAFTGKNLTVIGDPNSSMFAPSTYYDDTFQIDAKAQYAITKDFTVYADGNNLNNANHRYYQVAPQYPIQNEFYGPSLDAGVVVDF